MTDFSQSAAAVQFVAEGHNRFIERTDNTLNQAERYIAALSDFAATPTGFSVDFNFGGQLAQFQRPAAPTLNAADFDLRPQEQPGEVPEFEEQALDLDAMPVFDVATPTFSPVAKPVRPNIAVPTAPARPADLVMPDEPDYMAVAPEPITLLDLNLPTFPSLNLPEFTAQRPQLGALQLSDSFHYSPQQYVSALLTKIQGRVSTWLDGQEALPEAIERALFDRGRARIEVEVAAQVEQAVDDFGTRGFTAPQGLLVARIDGIRQAGQDRVAEFNRDTTIKSFDEALANMRLALQSGLQLEGITINLFMEQERLLLASAQHLRDTAIAIVNARIAHFNGELAGYEAEARTVEIRLRAELAKLEETRILLEGEKLKGDINEQTVRRYQAQWDAVKTLADFYRTRVDAVRVQAEANKLPFEIFAEETRAFDTLMDAYAKEWDGYRASIEGEASKAALHRNLVEAYSAQTQAVVQYGRLKLDREGTRIQQFDQRLRRYDGSLRRLGLLLDGERARLGAVGQRAGAEATLYQARATVESAASAATDRTFQLGLERARAEVETQLETARIRSNENVALSGLSLEALKSLAQILSQLAASTMSAVNYSASVGASVSSSSSRSVGWSGEADDWNASYV